MPNSSADLSATRFPHLSSQPASPRKNPLLLKSAPMIDQKVAKMQKILEKLPRKPKLLIIRDSDSPVIVKYVNLKINFGAKIGVKVEDFLADSPAAIEKRILAASQDPAIDGIILQLPIKDPSKTEELCALISPQKDVDGLASANPPFSSPSPKPTDPSAPASTPIFLSATVKAILDLLDFYRIDLKTHRIAIVGRGKLVGAPLARTLKSQNLNPAIFHRGSNLADLQNFDLIITATGVPGLIKSASVAPKTILIDAGTASEKGVLRGDLDPKLYDRSDITALTPQIGGVGPATVACLFENLLAAAENSQK